MKLEFVEPYDFLQLNNMIFRSYKMSMYHSITLEQLTIAGKEYPLLVGGGIADFD